MRRFLIKCLLFSGIILVSSVLFLRILVSFPNEYCRQSIEVNVIRQIDRMKTINQPKIVIIGGSGCGFGLCSPMISNHFEMPVCNIGTHAGIGLQTQINLCLDFIHNDDIVIVIPEYSNFLNNYFLGSTVTLRVLTTFYPEGYKYFTPRQQFYLIQYIPRAFRDVVFSRNNSFDENSPYSLHSLNDFGDVEKYDSRYHYSGIDKKFEKWENIKMQRKAVILLQDFYNYCEKRHAKMLLFPPAFKAMDFDVNKEVIRSIWMTLEEAELPCISTPERYRMADTLHFDTNYHLTYEGVMIRTNRLIADMDSALRVNDKAKH